MSATQTKKLRIAGQERDAIFFHKPEEPFGFLSNWYPSVFVLDGRRYTSNEQYIMYHKCLLLGDGASAERVLQTDDVAEQKWLGRHAAGFAAGRHVWAGARQMVGLRGLKAKFTQNGELGKLLLDTGDACLVECSESDKVWACGVSLYDERRFDAACWDGDNILGFALMEVRSALKK